MVDRLAGQIRIHLTVSLFFFVIYVCKKYSIIVVHYLQGISDLTLLVVRQEVIQLSYKPDALPVAQPTVSDH